MNRRGLRDQSKRDSLYLVEAAGWVENFARRAAPVISPVHNRSRA